MFDHDKLDWQISRLARRLKEGGAADADVAIPYAAACIARARFHGGDAQRYTDALEAARRVLHREPGHPEALVLAALALVLLDRAEPAGRYLDEARQTAPNDPRLHLALGEAANQAGDAAAAEAAFRDVVRLAPDAWEAHLVLGQALAQRARASSSARLGEEAQYHLVRALQLGPSAEEEPGALHALALLCLRGGRIPDAARLLHRLETFDAWRAEAWYHLGRVAARQGRHKKAIMYFREHLSACDDERADVWTRIGASYLHEGEPARAREACHRALLLDAHDVDARWILGAALIAEGHTPEAVRAFREILEIAPDHVDAFGELVRLRTEAGDARWLRQALRSEVAIFDRLPVRAFRDDPRTLRQVPIDPRASTRNRIRTLLRGLTTCDADVADTVLGSLDLTADEGLRFLLWESVLDVLAREKAADMADALADPGRHYGADVGQDVLTLAHLIDEERLVAGLGVAEDDLRRAAVERHGPADDVRQHRQNIARERQQARAWQALLLLAIAHRRSAGARNLLVRWASDADDEFQIPARAGLAMLGDGDAVEALRGMAAERQLEHLARLASTLSEARPTVVAPRLVTDQDGLVCATCSRRGSQVSHMVVGRGTAVCNVCLSRVDDARGALTSRDPELVCALTGATLLDADAIYVFNGVAISSTAVDMSVGHEEREIVSAWLATQ